MKYFVVFAAFFTIGLSAVHGQTGGFESRVAFIPTDSLEEDSRFDSVCTAIDDTVLLTLKLLGKYDLVEEIGLEQFSEPKVLPLVREENIDSLIFGFVDQREDGSIDINMSVWDRKEEQIVLTVTEKAETLFDIFDASDRIVVSLIEGFSGTHIGYGSIAFQPEGAEGDFIIELNGTFAGMNRAEMRNVLIGDYDLKITQDRMLGSRILYTGGIDVQEGKRTSISFTLPDVTEEEISYFRDLDAKIAQAVSGRTGLEEAIGIVEKTIDMLEGFPGYFAAQQKKYTELLPKISEQRAQKKVNSLDSARIKLARPIIPRLETLIHGSEMVNLKAENPHTSIFAGTFTEKQSQYKENLYDNLIPVVKRGDIRVDNRPDDWISIPVVITDPAGDSRQKGGDIISAKIARDETQIYTLISLADYEIFHPDGVYYGLRLENNKLSITLEVGYWGEAGWHWYHYVWDKIANSGRSVADGETTVGRGFIEQSYLISTIDNYIDLDELHTLHAAAGAHGRNFDEAKTAINIKIGEYTK